MKQVIQNIRNGELSIQTLPAPCVGPGEVLIANRSSLVSAGTEKILMDLAKKSLLGKAKERPDHVRRVIEKIRQEGLLTTIDQVRKKLDEPMPMGYSSAGVVIAVGAGVQHLKIGDRVASNGPHAEFVSVPQNLCGQVPEGVSWDHACFAILGSIAMQGVRLTKCTLGETVFVIGLGLIGQIAVQILKAAGFKVIGTDLDPQKCELALQLGADHAQPGISASNVQSKTDGLGADAVLITASTKSNQPISLAADSVRKRGRIVLVGVVGLELDRRQFYDKETEFVVSCSYGPGRYDSNYEQRGIDYPPAYVRWTEQRNIQSFLDLLGNGRVDLKPLVSHTFPIEKAEDAYHMIQNATEPFLGVVIQYPAVTADMPQQTIKVTSGKNRRDASGKIRYGILGAGNFARMTLLPAIHDSGRFAPVIACSAKGLSGTDLASKFGFSASTTDEDQVLSSDEISTVFSITRHDQHARHVLKALEQGKHVFVEKPLCIELTDLNAITKALNDLDGDRPQVMVGFNRRFSPAAKKVRAVFESVSEPLTISIRFNAGDIPADHWIQHDEEGGGRLIGEACHAIDLATYLCGSPPVRVFAESVGRDAAHSISDDECFITLRHANGSVSSIAYLAGGNKAYPKERVEVFGGGRVGVIHDFRQVETCTQGKVDVEKMRMDKGHRREIIEFALAIQNGTPAIPLEEILATSHAAIAAVESLRSGFPVELSKSIEQAGVE